MDLLDLIFMLATLGFFALCLAYIAFCNFLNGLNPPITQTGPEVGEE
jgi:hypothetical protein